MVILTPGGDISKIKSAADLYEEMPYFACESARDVLRGRERTSGLNLVGSELPIPANWRIDQPAKRLLLYHSGESWEQLQCTALARAIKKRRPFVKIDVAAGSDMQWCWTGYPAGLRQNKDVYAFRIPPLPASVENHYDGLILLDRGDDMFEAVGIEPEDVERVPNLTLYRNEQADTFFKLFPNQGENVSVTPGYIVLNLDAPRTQALPERAYRDFVCEARRSQPKLPVVCVSSLVEGELLQYELSDIPGLFHAHQKLKPRELACLIRLASCVVGPSGLPIHLAAAVNTPSVELCSTHSPQPYPLNVPIFRTDVCGAECNWTHSDFALQQWNRTESTECYSPMRARCSRMEVVTGADISLAYQIAKDRKFANNPPPFIELAA